MGTGTLVIQAQIGGAALPLSGVRMRISDSAGNLLYDLTTDESGRTRQVSLEAVDQALSLDPAYTGRPFSTYELLAEADGYNHVHIFDVQIFDGQDAIQPVFMLPLLPEQTAPETQEIYMGEHAVAMTEPRSQIGTTISARILPLVIIPNPITVHLGTPSSSASNVQVPFLDYVKNVASSEIYPTWPEESLRANIYAIITFALNRVFTQWYRSRGYAFDITSSTSYDQYFQYGRTIYASISRIVDEIFNQYVRRQGQNAPFFTSFCNGTTSTCAGLSQWGTVSLADQGWTAMEILRNYYPNDIEISQTDTLSDIVETYPGTPLQLGSTGRDVESIQNYLTRIRKNYPGIPLITDSPGIFGSSTQAAVATFQRVFNLADDGVVGRATWNKMINVYVAVARLAELDSEGTGLGIGTVPPNSVLQTGSSGMDVILLQYLLNYIGVFYPVIPRVTQDGRFGNATAQAVAAFQQRMGLGADGVVGAATWNALYSTYFSVKGTVPPPVPSPEPGPAPGVTTHTVRAGDTLWLLAQQYSTTVEAIRALNNLTSDVLRIGQILQIPATTPPARTHTVRSGDTLWLIAQQYNTTVAALRTLNNLTSDVLSIGQVLQIPGTTPPARTHTVRLGDTLWLLAQQYGTTVAAIRTLNNLTSDMLRIGQILQIPATTPPARTHTVRAGDTLWLLAQQYGTTVAALRTLNNLTSDVLRIGQVLRVE